MGPIAQEANEGIDVSSKSTKEQPKRPIECRRSVASRRTAPSKRVAMKSPAPEKLEAADEAGARPEAKRRPSTANTEIRARMIKGGSDTEVEFKRGSRRRLGKLV